MADCTLSRIKLYIKCKKICAKLTRATNSIQNCIKNAANEICTKLGQLHTCFPEQLKSACKNVCTNLNHTQLQAALQEVCQLVKDCFDKIRTDAIVKYIDRICGKECQCCKQAGATHDCTTHTCTTPGCICIKCAICKAASGICTAITTKANGWQGAVKEVCTSICRWLDNTNTEAANGLTSSAQTLDQACKTDNCATEIIDKIKTELNKLSNCADGCQCCTQTATGAEAAATCTCTGKNCYCLKCRVCTAATGISQKIQEACEGLTDGIQEACQLVCQRVDNIRDKWTQKFSGAVSQMGTNCNITLNVSCPSITGCSGCTFDNCGNSCNSQTTQDTQCAECDTEINRAACTDSDTNQPDTQTNNTSERNAIAAEVTKLLAGYAKSAVESACEYAMAAAADLKAACTKANNINTQLTGLINSNSFSNLGNEFYNKAKEIPSDEYDNETRAQKELDLIKYMQIGANINLI